MIFPGKSSRCGTTGWLLLVLAALCAGPSFGAGPKPVRPGDPVVTLNSDQYGYLPLPARYMVSGLSLLTLHFVDSDHLLFTFHTHGLLTRLADSNPEDNDRRVTAVLIELPSGKELARTVWRTRDQDQYLWPLAHGRFMLRIRSKLTVIDPVAGLASGHAFEEHPFLEFKRRIGYIAVSPGGDLLSVETLPARTQQDAGTGNAAEEETPAKSSVEIRFFRLAYVSDAEGKTGRVIAKVAGGLLTQTMVNIPATAEGFIDITKDKDTGYLFDFQNHAGKRTELAGYMTGCMPRSYFISRSEFVAFGCGLQDRVLLSEFNLRGEEPWVQELRGEHISPVITAAPDAGRFVLSRMLVSGTLVDASTVAPDQVSAQELTVMQNHSGRVLLRTQASPMQRAGQNFDLSPNGMWFATLQSTQTGHDDSLTQHTKIVVFHLPELTAADEKDLKLAATSTPEKNEAMIRLFSPREAKRVEAAAPNVITVGPSGTMAQMAAENGTVGDAAPEKPRKKPSLYDADHPSEEPKPKPKVPPPPPSPGFN